MQVRTQMKGLDSVRGILQKLSGPEMRRAEVAALNDVAFQKVRPGMQEEMRRNFKNPTSFVVRSVLVKPATDQQPTPTARVEPGLLGGNGMDPQKILQAQQFGGRRVHKRIESAFRRIGYLHAGEILVLPSQPLPSSVTSQGDLRGAFAQQLVSYFQAAGEQGYRANMTDKRRRQIQKGTQEVKGRRYFFSRGKLRDSTRHLAPGIWAAMGTGGWDLRPVLMVVRAGSYRPLVDLERIHDEPDTLDYLARRLRYRIRQVAGV